MPKQAIISHKPCVECGVAFGLIHSATSQEYAKRIFCGRGCLYKFNRRKNHGKPHPLEVQERMQKNDTLYDKRDPLTHRTA